VSQLRQRGLGVGHRLRACEEKQLSASFGTFPDLLGMGLGERRSLKVLQSVRCLECAGVYTKPAGGGTAAANPGCPECGYLGWSPLNAQEAWLQPRYDVDRRPRPPA
jgi:hypothetical protein